MAAVAEEAEALVEVAWPVEALVEVVAELEEAAWAVEDAVELEEADIAEFQELAEAVLVCQVVEAGEVEEETVDASIIEVVVVVVEDLAFMAIRTTGIIATIRITRIMAM